VLTAPYRIPILEGRSATGSKVNRQRNHARGDYMRSGRREVDVVFDGRKT